MKQKRRTKRLLALALLLASVLGLAGASQIASVSVAGTESEVTPTLPPPRFAELQTADEHPVLLLGSTFPLLLPHLSLTAVGRPSQRHLARTSVRTCDSAIEGIEHCEENGVHIFRIELDADIRFETVFADDVATVHSSERESVEDMATRDPYRNAVIAINADYFGSGHGAEGLTVKNGRRYDGLVCGADDDENATKRSSLAIAHFDYEGTREVDIAKGLRGMSPDDCTWDYWFNVLGGGPRIVENGNKIPMTQACQAEFFSDYWCYRWSTNPDPYVRQTAVGITEDDSTLILLVSSREMLLDEASDILGDEGAWTAMKFDGGDSTQLYYDDGNVKVIGRRDVAEGLLIFPRIAAPTNLDTDAVSASRVDLQWDWDDTNISEFRIERRQGESGDDWSEIATVDGDERDYSDESVDDDTTYCYRVRAYLERTRDISRYSNTSCATTPKANRPPTKPTLVSPPNDEWINDNTPTLDWEFNDPDNDPQGWYHVQVDDENSFNSPRVWERDEDSSDTHVTVGSPLSDDTYYWRVETKDPDGEESGWSDKWSFHLDTVPPDTTIIEGPSGPITTNDVTFRWTGSDDRTAVADLKYKYRLQYQEYHLQSLSDDWSDWTSNTSKNYTDLADGIYTFDVKARDKAFNEDPSPASRSFEVDTTPPETTITGGPSGCIGTADVTFTWTGSDNRTPTVDLLYSYKLEGFDDWSAWTGATSKSYIGLLDGDYTFKVKAQDGVGHEDPSPAAQSFRVDTTPPTGSILVNGGDSTTNKIAVHLDITGDDGPVGCGVTEMRLSNDGFNWEAWESFATEGEWLLPTLNRTTWTVHLLLKDLVGNVSEAFTDDIYMDLYPPRPASESYQLGARVVASGDPTSSSESYGLLSATMGQPIADGRLEGVTYRVESGYQGAWPSVPRGRPTPESYDINASLVASSGEYPTSESYRLQSAMGQPTDVGPRSSENYQLLSGYLPCKLLGDLDVNGRVDVADIMLVASKWRCRLGDDCYHERYDLDKDGDIDVVDIMLVVVHWGETC